MVLHLNEINKNYILGLKNLPVEVQKNLTLLGELDMKTKKLISGIDKETDDYLKSNAHLTDKKKKKMNRIQRQFNKAREYSDDKVQLAIQTYALVC